LNDIAILQVLDFVTNLHLLACGEKSKESWIKAKHRKNIAKQKNLRPSNSIHFQIYDLIILCNTKVERASLLKNIHCQPNYSTSANIGSKR